MEFLSILGAIFVFILFFKLMDKTILKWIRDLIENLENGNRKDKDKNSTSEQ